MAGEAKFSVTLDVAPVQAMLDRLGERALIRVWQRTLRKTSNWIKGQAAKEISRRTRIAQKLIKKRMHVYLNERGNDAKVWLGLNPVSAHRLRRVRLTKRGATVGRRRFDGAWQMAKRNGPQGPLFRRVGAARLPIEKVVVDWSEEGASAFREVAERIESRLLVVFRQEVNYEYQKVIGNVR